MGRRWRSNWPRAGVRVLSPRDLLSRSTAVWTFSRRPRPRWSDRHRSVRAVLDSSWRWLDDRERQVLRRLSVFVGSFSREAAVMVAGRYVVLTVVLGGEVADPATAGNREWHPLPLAPGRPRLRTLSGSPILRWRSTTRARRWLTTSSRCSSALRMSGLRDDGRCPAGSFDPGISRISSRCCVGPSTETMRSGRCGCRPDCTASGCTRRRSRFTRRRSKRHWRCPGMRRRLSTAAARAMACASPVTARCGQPSSTAHADGSRRPQRCIGIWAMSGWWPCSLQGWGYALRLAGAPEEAQLLEEQGLAIVQRLGDARGLAWASHDLGEIAFVTWRYRSRATPARGGLPPVRGRRPDLWQLPRPSMLADVYRLKAEWVLAVTWYRAVAVVPAADPDRRSGDSGGIGSSGGGLTETGTCRATLRLRPRVASDIRVGALLLLRGRSTAEASRMPRRRSAPTSGSRTTPPAGNCDLNKPWRRHAGRARSWWRSAASAGGERSDPTAT